MSGERWYPINRFDPRGVDLYNRHYSARRYQDGRRSVERAVTTPGRLA